MALKAPTPVANGDYLDLRAGTESGPLLVVFRIVEFLPGEPDDYGSTTYPVKADALVCSGPDKGTVYRGGVYKYAITNTLRGANRDTPQPVNEVGDELAVRCERAQKKGVPSNTVFGNVPSDAEMAAIAAVYDEMGGEKLWAEAAGPHAEPEPAAKSAGRRAPWKD